MAISMITITNISHQVIKVLYGTIPSGDSTSSFPYTDAGEIQIQPGAAAEIEEKRIDPGQIESLKRKGLLTTVIR